MAHKVNRINMSHLPLKAYEDIKAFKLFIADYKEENTLINLPLYAIEELEKLCNGAY